MKITIALRRVSTPTTPIVNSTAEMKSEASITGHPLARGRPRADRDVAVVALLTADHRAGGEPPAAAGVRAPAEHHRADDGREEQDARQLEGQQVLVGAEQRLGDAA